jgi:hypothetical protein
MREIFPLEAVDMLGGGFLTEDTAAGFLWETWCNNVRNTEQNEQMKKGPSVRAIICKILKLFRL